MKENCVLHYEAAFRTLANLLEKWGAKGDWCVVGSLALRKLSGIEIEPHDIDIELIQNPKIEEKLKVLAESQNRLFHTKEVSKYDTDAEKRMKRPVTWTHKPYIFKLEDTLVNVWIVNKFSNRFVRLDNGILYALPVDILDRKFAYRRPKDIGFGLKLIKGITDMLYDDTPVSFSDEDCNDEKQEKHD